MREGGLVVVVLNWNGADDTIACLRSLEAALREFDFRLLVVDNGSRDGSVGRIRMEFPDTDILELPSNLGYAGGNNAGFRRAEEMGAEEVLFLNNDTVVESCFALPLLTVLRVTLEWGHCPKNFLYGSSFSYMVCRRRGEPPFGSCAPCGAAPEGWLPVQPIGQYGICNGVLCLRARFRLQGSWWF